MDRSGAFLNFREKKNTCQSGVYGKYHVLTTAMVTTDADGTWSYALFNKYRCARSCWFQNSDYYSAPTLPGYCIVNDLPGFAQCPTGNCLHKLS